MISVISRATESLLLVGLQLIQPVGNHAFCFAYTTIYIYIQESSKASVAVTLDVAIHDVADQAEDVISSRLVKILNVSKRISKLT